MRNSVHPFCLLWVQMAFDHDENTNISEKIHGCILRSFFTKVSRTTCLRKKRMTHIRQNFGLMESLFSDTKHEPDYESTCIQIRDLAMETQNNTKSSYLVNV